MKLLVLLLLLSPNSRPMWHQTLLESHLGEDLDVSQL